MAVAEGRLEELANECQRAGVVDIDPNRRTVTIDLDQFAKRPRVLDVPREERRLVTGGDPDEPYPVPAKDDFEREFKPAPDLGRIASALIEAHPKRFRFLGEYCRVVYLWKAEGGLVNYRATLGKCAKPGGLLKLFSDAHFIIWLAADHARSLRLSRWQVEALLFHEMSHASLSEGRPALVGHDFAGFRGELEEYGAWESDLRAMASAVSQLPLFGAAEAPESAEEE